VRELTFRRPPGGRILPAMRTLGWLRLAVLVAGLALLFVPVAHAAPIGNL